MSNRLLETLKQTRRVHTPSVPRSPVLPSPLRGRGVRGDASSPRPRGGEGSGVRGMRWNYWSDRLHAYSAATVWRGVARTVVSRRAWRTHFRVASGRLNRRATHLWKPYAPANPNGVKDNSLGRLAPGSVEIMVSQALKGRQKGGERVASESRSPVLPSPITPRSGWPRQVLRSRLTPSS